MTPMEWFTEYLDLTGSVQVGVNWQCPSHADSFPSMSVSEADNSDLLIYCHAGCETIEVLESLGLGTRALFKAHPLKPGDFYSQSSVKPAYEDFCWQSGGSSKRDDVRMKWGRPSKISTDYHRYNETNRLVRVRYDNGRKQPYWQVLQYGKWVPSIGLKKDELPIYRSEIVEFAIANGVSVILCESESSVDALEKAGFVATTWAGGASSPKIEKLKMALGNADVVLIPDNDDAGLRCEAKLNEKLAPFVRSWRVVRGELGEDARDLLERLGAEEFQNYISSER
jgi:putative DNA primase/helicase